MNIDELLRCEEGKTLEFKRDLSSPQKLQIMEIGMRSVLPYFWPGNSWFKSPTRKYRLAQKGRAMLAGRDQSESGQ